MFSSALPSALKYSSIDWDLFSDKLVCRLRHADIYGKKSHSWKAVTMVHYIYLFCAFTHIRTFYRHPNDGGKAKFCEPKRSREETSLDPCCLSDFIYCRDLNSFFTLDVSSVSRVCSRHQSHGEKWKTASSRRGEILYGSQIQSIIHNTFEGLNE